MSNSAGPKITKDGLVLDFDAANYKSYPAAQDTYVNNVSLMLDGESLTDKSQNAVAVTVQGAVTVDSSVKKIGNSSLKFGGALADCLTVPSSSLFAFPGDFTIEFWTYANQWGQRSGATVYFCNGVLNQFQLAVYPATQIDFYLNGSSFINVPLSASIVGRWVHIALVRSGSTITIYENGTSVGSGTSSYSIPASICYIGKQLPRSPINYGHNLDGYIDDLRVTKSARYTANFTPPAAPLSLPGRITDLTKNKYLATLVNSPTFTSSNGGAINLSGSASQYLTVNGGMPSGISTGFTFECWVRVTDLASRRAIIQADDNIGTGLEIVVETTGAVKCGEYKSKDFTDQICITASGAVAAGAWTHITVSRTTGDLYTIYINGVSKATGTRAFIIEPTTKIGYADEESAPLALNFKGDMSIIRNYNRTLTSTEVYNNFVANRGRFGV